MHEHACETLKACETKRGNKTKARLNNNSFEKDSTVGCSLCVCGCTCVVEE